MSESPQPLQQSSPGLGAIVAAVVRIGLVATTLLLFAAIVAIGEQSLIYLPLIFTLPVTLVCVVVSRIVGAVRRRITLDLLRQPFARASRGVLLQFLNRTLCCVAVASAILLAVPGFVLPDNEWFAAIAIFAVAPAILLIVAELFPVRPVRWSYNLLFLAVWLYLGVQFSQIFLAPRFAEPVTLAAPFRGEWVVFQGGRSTLLNHHYPIRAQRHALDLTLRDVPRSGGEQPQRLDVYATFGQPIVAPASGRVGRAVGIRPDQQMGTADLELLVGNHVVIEMADGRYVLLAHLQQGSLLVTEGDMVQAGDLIARCGNSGNTTEPHLHLQVQSRIDWDAPDAETWPIRFSDVTHFRWGRSYASQQGELIRNDRVVPRAAGAGELQADR